MVNQGHTEPGVSHGWDSNPSACTATGSWAPSGTGQRQLVDVHTPPLVVLLGGVAHPHQRSVAVGDVEFGRQPVPRDRPSRETVPSESTTASRDQRERQRRPRLAAVGGLFEVDHVGILPSLGRTIEREVDTTTGLDSVDGQALRGGAVVADAGDPRVGAAERLDQDRTPAARATARRAGLLPATVAGGVDAVREQDHERVGHRVGHHGGAGEAGVPEGERRGHGVHVPPLVELEAEPVGVAGELRCSRR